MNRYSNLWGCVYADCWKSECVVSQISAYVNFRTGDGFISHMRMPEIPNIRKGIYSNCQKVRFLEGGKFEKLNVRICR
jgi:hypothetical protein